MQARLQGEHYRQKKTATAQQYYQKKNKKTVKS